MAEEYKSVHPGPDIDAAVTRALAGGPIDKALSEKLSQSGGKMTGTLVQTAYPAIRRDDNAGQHITLGGSSTAAEAGAKLCLYGGENSGNPGEFLLQAGTRGEASTIFSQLRGKADGELTWAGNRVATVISPTEYALAFTPEYAATHNISKYWKDQFGVVTVYLSVQAVSAIPSGTTIATLPAGFRPASYRDFNVITNGGNKASINVLTGGGIRISAVDAGTIIQFGFSFVAGS